MGVSAILDARSTEVAEEQQADVCLIGAGAAGITLARKLGAAAGRVLLVESGDVQSTVEAQSLYADPQVGLPYLPLAACRLRYFGGTTNHWAGYCRLNQPTDFAARDDLGTYAWPVGEAELAPYVLEAHRDLGLGPELAFDATEVMRGMGLPARDLVDRQSAELRTPVSRIVPNCRFGARFGAELARRPGLRTLLNANAVHLQLDPGGRRLASVRIRTTTGRTLTVRARRFVLCCHAIENARLLLASNDIAADGIGNGPGHVGRYFQEHPAVVSGVLVPSRELPLIYDAAAMLARGLDFNIGLSAARSRQEHVLQYFCRFWPVRSSDEVRHALGRMADGFWRPADLRLLASMGVVARNVPEAARLALERLRLAAPLKLAYQLEHRIEQASNAASRVTLSEERDSLGNRRACLAWNLNDTDYRTFEVGQAVVIRELSALGLGRFHAPPLTRELVSRTVEGRNHHIGTTRMSAQPVDGVVDRNCRVHGIDNLYVGGSGIFPSSGDGSPTLLLTAFAMRLADHLNSLGVA